MCPFEECFLPGLHASFSTDRLAEVNLPMEVFMYIGPTGRCHLCHPGHSLCVLIASFEDGKWGQLADIKVL